MSTAAESREYRARNRDAAARARQAGASVRHVPVLTPAGLERIAEDNRAALAALNGEQGAA